MQLLLLIPILLFFTDAQCQLKSGKYSQLDTTVYANLSIFGDNTFNFYDTREPSCHFWMEYSGKWDINKDTIIFSWENTYEGSSDSIIFETRPESKKIEINFFYDSGEPIRNVKTGLNCLSDKRPKYYFSGKSGKVILPKISCDKNERIVSYHRNKVLDISSSKSIDYYTDSIANIFTIIVKRRVETITERVTKKYLIQGDSLIDVDRKEYYNLNWGNFKFEREEYGR